MIMIINFTWNVFSKSMPDTGEYTFSANCSGASRFPISRLPDQVREAKILKRNCGGGID